MCDCRQTQCWLEWVECELAVDDTSTWKFRDPLLQRVVVIVECLGVLFEVTLELGLFVQLTLLFLFTLAEAVGSVDKSVFTM